MSIYKSYYCYYADLLMFEERWAAKFTTAELIDHSEDMTFIYLYFKPMFKEDLAFLARSSRVHRALNV